MNYSNFRDNESTLEFKRAVDDGNLKQAKHIFEIGKKEKTIKVNTHFAMHHLLIACAKNGNIKEAFKNYQKMKKMSLIPNLQTFRLLLNTIAESKMNNDKSIEDHLEYIQNEMNNKYQIKADSGFYNTLLKLYVEHKFDEDRIFKLIDMMENDESIGINVSTYTMLMQLYADKGDMEHVLSLFEKMQEKKMLQKKKKPQ